MESIKRDLAYMLTVMQAYNEGILVERASKMVMYAEEMAYRTLGKGYTAWDWNHFDYRIADKPTKGGNESTENTHDDEKAEELAKMFVTDFLNKVFGVQLDPKHLTTVKDCSNALCKPLEDTLCNLSTEDNVSEGLEKAMNIFFSSLDADREDFVIIEDWLIAKDGKQALICGDKAFNQDACDTHGYKLVKVVNSQKILL